MMMDKQGYSTSLNSFMDGTSFMENTSSNPFFFQQQDDEDDNITTGTGLSFPSTFELGDDLTEARDQKKQTTTTKTTAHDHHNQSKRKIPAPITESDDHREELEADPDDDGDEDEEAAMMFRKVNESLSVVLNGFHNWLDHNKDITNTTATPSTTNCTATATPAGAIATTAIQDSDTAKRCRQTKRYLEEQLQAWRNGIGRKQITSAAASTTTNTDESRNNRELNSSFDDDLPSLVDYSDHEDDNDDESGGMSANSRKGAGRGLQVVCTGRSLLWGQEQPAEEAPLTGSDDQRQRRQKNNSILQNIIFQGQMMKSNECTTGSIAADSSIDDSMGDFALYNMDKSARRQRPRLAGRRASMGSIPSTATSRSIKDTTPTPSTRNVPSGDSIPSKPGRRGSLSNEQVVLASSSSRRNIADKTSTCVKQQRRSSMGSITSLSATEVIPDSQPKKAVPRVTIGRRASLDSMSTGHSPVTCTATASENQTISRRCSLEPMNGGSARIKVLNSGGGTCPHGNDFCQQQSETSIISSKTDMVPDGKRKPIMSSHSPAVPALNNGSSNATFNRESSHPSSKAELSCSIGTSSDNNGTVRHDLLALEESLSSMISEAPFDASRPVLLPSIQNGLSIGSNSNETPMVSGRPHTNFDGSKCSLESGKTQDCSDSSSTIGSSPTSVVSLMKKKRKEPKKGNTSLESSPRSLASHKSNKSDDGSIANTLLSLENEPPLGRTSPRPDDAAGADPLQTTRSTGKHLGAERRRGDITETTLGPLSSHSKVSPRQKERRRNSISTAFTGVFKNNIQQPRSPVASSRKQQLRTSRRRNSLGGAEETKNRAPITSSLRRESQGWSSGSQHSIKENAKKDSPMLQTRKSTTTTTTPRGSHRQSSGEPPIDMVKPASTQTNRDDALDTKNASSPAVLPPKSISRRRGSLRGVGGCGSGELSIEVESPRTRHKGGNISLSALFHHPSTPSPRNKRKKKVPNIVVGHMNKSSRLLSVTESTSKSSDMNTSNHSNSARPTRRRATRRASTGCTTTDYSPTIQPDNVIEREASPPSEERQNKHKDSKPSLGGALGHKRIGLPRHHRRASIGSISDARVDLRDAVASQDNSSGELKRSAHSHHGTQTSTRRPARIEKKLGDFMVAATSHAVR